MDWWAEADEVTVFPGSHELRGHGASEIGHGWHHGTSEIAGLFVPQIQSDQAVKSMSKQLWNWGQRYHWWSILNPSLSPVRLYFLLVFFYSPIGLSSFHRVRVHARGTPTTNYSSKLEIALWALLITASSDWTVHNASACQATRLCLVIAGPCFFEVYTPIRYDHCFFVRNVQCCSLGSSLMGKIRRFHPLSAHDWGFRQSKTRTECFRWWDDARELREKATATKSAFKNGKWFHWFHFMWYTLRQVLSTMAKGWDPNSSLEQKLLELFQKK